jgi:non-ribosomal peptide synthase protein (TIGR01720 family)
VKLTLVGDTYGDYIKHIKEQLRLIPHKGIGYGVLRYLENDNILRQQYESSPQILFNYLGKMDSEHQEGRIFNITQHRIGSCVDLNNRRFHELEINCHIICGQLKINFAYNKQKYQEETIKTFAIYYMDHLNEIINQCRNIKTAEYTPSDVPLAKLNQKELDRIIQKIKRK